MSVSEAFESSSLLSAKLTLCFSASGKLAVSCRRCSLFACVGEKVRPDSLSESDLGFDLALFGFGASSKPGPLIPDAKDGKRSMEVLWCPASAAVGPVIKQAKTV